MCDAESASDQPSCGLDVLYAALVLGHELDEGATGGDCCVARRHSPAAAVGHRHQRAVGVEAQVVLVADGVADAHRLAVDQRALRIERIGADGLAAAVVRGVGAAPQLLRLVGQRAHEQPKGGVGAVGGLEQRRHGQRRDVQVERLVDDVGHHSLLGVLAALNALQTLRQDAAHVAEEASTDAGAHREEDVQKVALHHVHLHRG
mmetsp:Transcript_26549/g.66817  ORF Transcript_26549/g.66817 Transcript_26549/m.66817 type:complete len:204 (-) Transcript_26549:941-1552(-)